MMIMPGVALCGMAVGMVRWCMTGVLMSGGWFRVMMMAVRMIHFCVAFRCENETGLYAKMFKILTK